MRRITAALLALVCISFVACNEGKPADTPAQTTDGGSTAANGTFSDLKATVDAVKGYYGDGTEFIFMADEYSDEVLMYTYGLMDEKFVSAVEDFVLTECDGMSADTFAVVKFKAGTALKEKVNTKPEKKSGKKSKKK